MASLGLASILAAPPAHAGTYTATGSGGTSPSTVTPAADATYSDPFDATARSSVSPMSRNGDPTYTININPGTLTTTFTWVPASGQTMTTDPPPTCVLVQQSSYAQWYVRFEGGTGTGSGNPDCGLSGGTITPGTFGGNGPSQSLSATLYSQKSGASVSVSSTPTVSFTGTTGTEGYVEGEARVGGGANVYPITITPGGTYNPSAGDYHVLTGQQITATLYGIPSNYTVTKYTWSGQSGTCFKTYNEKAPSNPLVPLVSTDLSGPAAGSKTVAPLAFYDSAAENLTITCAVTVMAPDGKSTVTLTATAPPINVLKPTLTRWDIAKGYVQYNPNTDNGPAYGLYGNLSSTNLTSTNGMIWSNVTVDVPAPFSGNGQCTFTQLVNPDRLAYISGTSTPLVPNNGILGLDGSFDYGSRWNVTAVGNGVDDPNQPLFYKTGLTEISASDAFTTYVMYQPNGGVWVPLEKISWTWSATLDWQPQTSQFSLTSSYPHTAGQAGTPAYVPISDPPQWTVVHH